MFVPLYHSLCQIPYYFQVVKISTTCAIFKSYDVRTSRMMNKMLNSSHNKKKKFYAVPFGGSPQNFDFVLNHKTSHKNDRRLTVLNKVFMKNITDLMSTGEISQEVTGKGIQISKVKVTPTFHQINVHWLANGTADDTENEKLLAEIAPKLRHELSQLRIMGAVPKIEFVKDLSYLKYMIVENILKTADFGDDFERTPLANDWKSDDSLKTHLPCDKKDTSNEEQELTTTVVDQPLPVMRMDTLGLDYDAIMKRVNQSIKRARAIHRRDPLVNLQSDDVSEMNETVSVLSKKERKKLFREFITKKKLEWKKSLSAEKKYRPELVIMEQERESKLVNEFLHGNDDDDDYLEEFDRNSSYLEDDYSKN